MLMEPETTPTPGSGSPGRARTALAFALAFAAAGSAMVLLASYVRIMTERLGSDSTDKLLYNMMRTFASVRESEVGGALLAWLSILLAAAMTRRILSTRDQRPASGRVLDAILIMTLFLMIPFHILMWLGLVTGWACVAPFDAALMLLGCAVAMTFWERRPMNLGGLEEPPPSIPPGRLDDFLWSGALLLIAAAFVGILCFALRQIRGFDGLWYHLPLAKMWFDWRTPSVGMLHSAFFYPSNMEAFLWYLTAARAIRALSCVELAAALAAVCAVHRIGRLLGAGRGAALLGAAVLATMPVTLRCEVNVGNDITVGAFLLMATAYVIEAWVNPARARGALRFAALAFGLAAGTKYNALFVLPVLGSAASFLAWIHASGAGWTRVWRWGRSMALLMLLVLLPSAFWYARNAAATGNPLHPFRVSVAGVEIFPGEPPTEFRADKQAEFVNAPREWWYYPFAEKAWAAGWGAVFAGVGLLMAAAAPCFALRFRKRFPARASAAALLFALGVCATLAWTSLGAREPRYLFHLYGLAGVFTALLLTLGSVVWRSAIGAVVLVGCAANLVLFTARTPGELRLDDRAAFEITQPEILARLDALAPATILSHPLGPYTAMLSGSSFQHRVWVSFQVDYAEAMRRRADYVVVARELSAKDPPGPEFRDPTRFELLAEGPTVDRFLQLYRVKSARVNDSLNFLRRFPPDEYRLPPGTDPGLGSNLLDGDLNTGLLLSGEPEPWIELRWSRPLNLAWLRLEWNSMTFRRYNVETLRDGNWSPEEMPKSRRPRDLWARQTKFIKLDQGPIMGLLIWAKREPGDEYPQDVPPNFQLLEIVGIEGCSALDQLRFVVFATLGGALLLRGRCLFAPSEPRRDPRARAEF